jgi:hypothetical protein
MILICRFARAILYFKIAEAWLKIENDKQRAVEILETGVKAALKASNGVERVQVLLRTAFRFCKYNEFCAGEVLSEAVKTANSLEKPDLSTASVYRKIQGKTFGYVSSFAMPGYNLEKKIAAIAKVDFQTALVKALSLDDKFLHTLAVIAVVGDSAAAEEIKPKKSGKAKSVTAKRP